MLMLCRLCLLVACIASAAAFLSGTRSGGTWTSLTGTAPAACHSVLTCAQKRFRKAEWEPVPAGHHGLRSRSTPSLFGQKAPTSDADAHTFVQSKARIINEHRPFSGYSDFRRVIRNRCCYVDRTQFIAPLLDRAPVIFLRPRRFGKSLWLSTLAEFFSGNTEAFKGLAVYDDVIERAGFRWSPTQPEKHNFPACPVIHLDFSGLTTTASAAALEAAMQQMLANAAFEHSITVEKSELGTMFQRLILELAMHPANKWKSVVVLIDEYDSVWAKFLRTEHNKDASEMMKGFMSALKGMARVIEFTFVTGVASVALTGYFSGPNDLNDVSLDSSLSTLCGFTQPEVEDLLKAKKLNFDMDEVRKRYNGYSWDTTNLKNTVYSPFVIGKICDKRELGDFWTATSSQSIVQLLNGARPELALPKTITKGNLLHVRMGDTSNPALATSDHVLSFLYYGGYATVKKARKLADGDTEFQLDYPNEEAKSFIGEDLFKFYGATLKATYLGEQSQKMVDCLYSNPPNMERFFQIFNDILATTSGRPAKDAADFEGLYQTILGIILGFDSRCDALTEANVLRGYADMVIRLKQSRRVFIFELKAEKGSANKANGLKWTKIAQAALEQIESKRYEAAAFATGSDPQPEILKYAVVCDSAAKHVALVMSSSKQEIWIPTQSTNETTTPTGASGTA